MPQLGANVHGEVLEPGRVPDCHLGLRLEYHECVPCCRTVIGGWSCRSTRCPEAPQPGVSGDPAAEEDARFRPDRMPVADVYNEQFLPAAVRAVRDGGDALSWTISASTNLKQDSKENTSRTAEGLV